MSEVEQIILPDGFKRVEYLQSSGTQWIQTDYCPCSETKIVSNCYFIKAGANGRFFGNGSMYNGGTDTFTAFMSAWTTGAIIFDFGNIRKDKNNYNLSVGKHTIIVDKNGIMVDGNIALATNHTITFQSTHSLSFFAAGGETSQDGDHWRIYDFIIYERGEVICHFIPCLNDDNEPCMFDVINKKSYTNAGSGQFYYPRDYPSSNYNLPSGFKKCVYLQSDGTQWINTGVIPSIETGFYFKALQLTYGNFVPFGVEGGSNGIYPPRFNSKDLYYKWGGTGIKMMTWDKAGDLIFHSSLNLYDSKIAKFDSEDTDVETNITSQTGTFTLPIWLFSYNLNGSYSATYGKWIGRIYRAQITQGADLIHDYVPCLDANGRPCMYDIIGGGTIEDNTYYNQSSGTEFAYCVEHQLPSDFVKLKYLEDNGTQFIDTKIVPNNETGLYVDAQQNTHTNAHVIGSGIDSNSTGFGVPRFLKGTANTCGFMWKGWISYGSIGNGTRFEGCLNLYNDRKATLKTAGATERINTLGELGFTPTVPLYMFRTNYASAGNWNGRIYRAKITQGSEIVRDFVPAFDELKVKPCMYDLINNVAYYNDGEGDFLYNRDVEGTYKGYTGLGCIGNRLGTSEFEWKIPYGYRRVAYLESTGTQYIKTGLKADRLNSIVDFMPFYATNGGSGSYYLGCWNKNSNYQIGAQQYENNNQGVITMMKINNTNNKVQFAIKSGTRITGEINFTEKFLRMGTKKLEMPDLINYPYPNTTVYLFAQNTVGDSNTAEGGPQQIPRGRIYSFKANYDGIPAADYIPCLDPNNKPCMFDIITQQPFYNQGTGEDFTYGII